MSSIRKHIHKDYIKRARAYRQKQQALRKLKLKAALRNPDEFYLKRIKTKQIGVFYKLKDKIRFVLADKPSCNNTDNNGKLQPMLIQRRASPEPENPHIKRGIKGFVEFPKVV